MAQRVLDSHRAPTRVTPHNSSPFADAIHPKLRLAVIVVSLLCVPAVPAAAEPDFRREIRPILSEHCFQCHGFDEQAREGELRLDQFASATRPAASGLTAIVPSHSDQSELVKRITSSDPEVRMPPQIRASPASCANASTSSASTGNRSANTVAVAVEMQEWADG